MNRYLDVARGVVYLMAVAMIIAGCSSASTIATSDTADNTDTTVERESADESAAGEPATDPSPQSQEPAASATADESTDTDNADSVPAESAAAEPELEPEPELLGIVDGPVIFEGLDVPVIAVTSGAGGEGSRPILGWTAVEGAATYRVSLLAPSGELYWAWSGSTSSVPVGGEPLLGPNSAGPAVIPGMSWYVLALDTDGLIIGQSPLITTGP